MAVDTTLVSPVRRDGRPRPRADAVSGLALRKAERTKERTYPELLGGARCRLQVIALEVGGRWSNTARTFVRLLARSRARSIPAGIRTAARQAFAQRWGELLSISAQRALAISLLELPAESVPSIDGSLPDISEILEEGRAGLAPVVSRLLAPA